MNILSYLQISIIFPFIVIEYIQIPNICMQQQKPTIQPQKQPSSTQNPTTAAQQQQITPQTIQQFNKVCQQATQLMLSYKQQSQNLKNEITSMVTIYNKNANPNQAVPVQKIIQITSVYETQMRNAHNQYQYLEGELRKEEGERDDMMKEILMCFEKLEKMEKVLKERKAKEAQEKKEKQAKSPQQASQQNQKSQTKQAPKTEQN